MSTNLDELAVAYERCMRAVEDLGGDSDSAELGVAKFHAAVAALDSAEIPVDRAVALEALRQARLARAYYLFEKAHPDAGEFPHPMEPADGTQHAGALRCIFGNPFRPVVFDPRWRSADAVGVARGIYEDRAFGRLPLLADALMDAGCDDEQVIGHCRSDGPHVRGCWVVDMILGKE